MALLVSVGIAMATVTRLGHHSRAMFDISKNITLRGVVQEYGWQAPTATSSSESHPALRLGRR